MFRDVRRRSVEMGPTKPKEKEREERRIPGLPEPLAVCVLVTVPANALIQSLTTEHAESDRMPPS
jgi:hypothetical protein